MTTALTSRTPACNTPVTINGRRTARRVGSVLAGLVAIFAITTATDIALHLAGVFAPPSQPFTDGPFVLATVYRIVYGILGAYITARLAPDRAMPHALVLGAIGFVISVAGACVMGDAGPSWYAFVIIAIALPCAWLGGRLGSKRAST